MSATGWVGIGVLQHKRCIYLYVKHINSNSTALFVVLDPGQLLLPNMTETTMWIGFGGMSSLVLMGEWKIKESPGLYQGQYQPQEELVALLGHALRNQRGGEFLRLGCRG